ncbi:hypothetical protein KC19_10G131500 [Ceratodon purpureus]|uniref:DNA polymerase delta subunit 3 n=1 Tax=Ceratodon purpureus TaxID=3225 RepID=A0A8T0GMM0_CERPU|nr:hypothetical protein KC19_10G131500 [Ceratodon purpureus]
MGDVLLDSGILDQIQSLVFDASQVVSYKWLSRKFSVSSNAAKRILQEFAKQNEGNKVEVVYTVSGWSKCEPRAYSVQLVPKAKLHDAKHEFDGSASHHVYSVQPCLPKDPAQLFIGEYVQAQELFLQPLDVNNCLRDNRFGSVSYSHVSRDIGGSKSVIDKHKGMPSSSVPLSSKTAAGSITPKLEPQALQPTPSNPVSQKEAAVKNTVAVAVAKGENSSKNSTTIGVPTKAGTENVVTEKKKTGATGGGSSLANLWGRAPAKVKDTTPPETTAKPVRVSGDEAEPSSDEEAGIRAMENDGSEPGKAGNRAMENDGSELSSDQEASDFARIRRCQAAKNGKGRKRQVVFDEDLSDDEDVMNSQVAINLASPLPFKKKPQVKTDEPKKMKAEVKIDHTGPTEMEIDEEKKTISNLQSDVVASILEISSKPVESSGGVKREAESESGPGTSAQPPSGPKRKKVFKTRINESGKEVTEVVWETNGVEEISEGKPAPVADKVPVPPAVSKVPAERPSAPAKAPQKTTAKGPGKAGGKAAAKGPGQGSLLSFFNKKT